MEVGKQARPPQMSSVNGRRCLRPLENVGGCQDFQRPRSHYEKATIFDRCRCRRSQETDWFRRLANQMSTNVGPVDAMMRKTRSA
jgi:hypothetical protein